MKLELIKKYEPDNVKFCWSCVAPDEETAIILTVDSEWNHSLFLVSPDGMKHVPLNYVENAVGIEHAPVLFSITGGFGIIKNPEELYYYRNIDSSPEKIEIENKKLFGQILPPKTRLTYPCSTACNNTLPVCFQHTYFAGHYNGRYFAFLNLDTEKRKAKWESWASLDKKPFPYHFKGSFDEPPVLDNIMLADNDVYLFTSGDNESVNKPGMKNYGIFKTTRKGEIVETLLDSGNLYLIDEKKRGVNGVFASSRQYAILTPVFHSDEWKGKQKLFSMATKELIDIQFPRGFGKHPRILQHSGKYFFVFIWETKHFAVCKEA